MADFPPIFHRFLSTRRRWVIGDAKSAMWIAHQFTTDFSPSCHRLTPTPCCSAMLLTWPIFHRFSSRRWKIGQAKIGVKSAMWRAHQFPIVFSPTSTNSEFEVEHCSTFCHRFLTDSVLVDFLTSSTRQTFCPIWLVVADQMRRTEGFFQPSSVVVDLI